jgi:hypothetical protein
MRGDPSNWSECYQPFQAFCNDYLGARPAGDPLHAVIQFIIGGAATTSIGAQPSTSLAAPHESVDVMGFGCRPTRPVNGHQGRSPKAAKERNRGE